MLKEELEEAKEELELRKLEEEELKEGDVGEEDGDAAKLQLALKKVYADYERDKVAFQDRLAELEGQAAELPDLQLRAKELDTTLRSKETEIQNLREALDEAYECNDMIEKLTEDNIKQSERVTELEAQIKELEEIREIENQIAEDQAELEKELNDEIANKDFEIQEF
jgi:hypothetical protein